MYICIYVYLHAGAVVVSLGKKLYLHCSSLISYINGSLRFQSGQIWLRLIGNYVHVGLHMITPSSMRYGQSSCGPLVLPPGVIDYTDP